MNVLELLLLKSVLFISAKLKEVRSTFFKLSAKFDARKKDTIPINSKNEPLSIIKVEMIIIPMGRLTLIKNFVIYIWIYKYII